MAYASYEPFRQEFAEPLLATAGVRCIANQSHVFVNAGVTSRNAPPPPSLRVVKEFDEAEAQAGIDQAHDTILRNLAKRRRQRWRLVRWLTASAPLATVFAAAWLLSSRQRRTQRLIWRTPFGF